MQSTGTRSEIFITVLHSADHARLVAAFLSIDELLAASSLSRGLHAMLDSEPVWQHRLAEAQRIQHVECEPVPASAVLSPAQLAALPPLPSLTEAAALCRQALADHKEADGDAQGSTPPHAERIIAIVHLPSTLVYHTRVIRPASNILMANRQSETYVPDYQVSHIEFSLAYDTEQQEWTVDSFGDCGCRTSVLNVDDNVELDDSDDNDTQPSVIVHLDTVSSSSSGSGGSSASSKQRYIAMMQCSEHVHNRCHTLLPPSPPLEADDVARDYGRGRPPLCPPPLCASCLTPIVGSIAYSTVGLIRINTTLFEASYICGYEELGARLSIAYQDRTAERTKTQNNKRRLRGDSTAERHKGRYTVTARYGDEAWYVDVHNVCYGCVRGWPASRSEGKCAECEVLDLGH